MNRVYLEVGRKKVFACSADWPGWCRSGKTEEAALDALIGYVPRYAVIAGRAGLDFAPGDPVVVEQVTGDATTDFGAPSVTPQLDLEPVGATEAAKAVALIRASWAALAEVSAASPEELRKGPRGGGRDRDKMVAHVIEAERSYARSIGVRHKPFPLGTLNDPQALSAMRDEIADVLSRPSPGGPVARGWCARYAARRIAWHVIDHIWEMEDRAG
ncbi:hypothetical protein ACFFHJ_00270 [Planotetraspora thailandica]|nr:hypothetical protein [Planotetraspora thailandica]